MTVPRPEWLERTASLAGIVEWLGTVGAEQVKFQGGLVLVSQTPTLHSFGASLPAWHRSRVESFSLCCSWRRIRRAK